MRSRALKWPPAVPALIECLDDPDKWARWEAVLALDALRDRELVPVFAGVLRWDDATARSFATDALAALGHRSAVPALIEALGDPKRGVFNTSRKALQSLVQPEDKDALERQMRQLSRRRRSKARPLLEIIEQRDRDSIRFA